VTRINGPRAERHSNEIALRRVVEAAEAIDSAEPPMTADTLAMANRCLREAVQAAHSGGASWQSIADVLGMRRGAAYQRFRFRREPPEGSDPSAHRAPPSAIGGYAERSARRGPLASGGPSSSTAPLRH
jgi:hypothetical protein